LIYDHDSPVSKQGYVAAFGGIIGVEGSVELVRADLVGGGVSLVGDPHIYLFIYFISVNNSEVPKRFA
jgi:hypothetical protein